MVGADGAWSKVCDLLASEARPSWAGIGLCDMRIPNAAETAPKICKIVKRGSTFANSNGRRLLIQQMGDVSLSMYALMAGCSEDWASPDTCRYNSRDLGTVKKGLLVQYQNWRPELTDAIIKTAGKWLPISLYIIPVGFKWPHRRGVTVIVDAAHLMMPFASMSHLRTR